APPPTAGATGTLPPHPSEEAPQPGVPPSLAHAEATLRDTPPLPRCPEPDIFRESSPDVPRRSLDGASREFRAVIARDRPSARALRGLGRCELLLDDYPGAAATYA